MKYFFGVVVALVLFVSVYGFFRGIGRVYTPGVTYEEEVVKTSSNGAEAWLWELPLGKVGELVYVNNVYTLSVGEKRVAANRGQKYASLTFTTSDTTALRFDKVSVVTEKVKRFDIIYFTIANKKFRYNEATASLIQF